MEAFFVNSVDRAPVEGIPVVTDTKYPHITVGDLRIPVGKRAKIENGRVRKVGVMPIEGEEFPLIVEPDSRLKHDNRALVLWRVGSRGPGFVFIATSAVRDVWVLGCEHALQTDGSETVEVLVVLKPRQELQAFIRGDGREVRGCLTWDGRRVRVKFTRVEGEEGWREARQDKLARSPAGVKPELVEVSPPTRSRPRPSLAGAWIVVVDPPTGEDTDGEIRLIEEGDVGKKAEISYSRGMLSLGSDATIFRAETLNGAQVVVASTRSFDEGDEGCLFADLSGGRVWLLTGPDAEGKARALHTSVNDGQRVVVATVRAGRLGRC